jgi:hypothetical protein
MSEKKQYTKLTTPKGVASFPKLTKPETKVGEKVVKPRFTCGVILDESDPATQKLVATLQGLLDAAVADYKAANPVAKGKKAPNLMPILPVRPAKDKEGNEIEGKIKIVAKTAATKKDGGPRVVPLFDAKGKPVKFRPNVSGGSTVKMNFTASPYDKPERTGIEIGIALYLEAVQIIDLVEFGGGNAESFGFSAEDGYEAEEGGSFNADGDSPAASTDSDDTAPTEGSAKDF